MSWSTVWQWNALKMPQGAFRRPPRFAFTFLALYSELIEINENKACDSRTSAGHVEFTMVTVAQYCLWLQSTDCLKVSNLTCSESIKSNALELLSSSIMFHSFRFPPVRLVFFPCLFDLNLPKIDVVTPATDYEREVQEVKFSRTRHEGTEGK